MTAVLRAEPARFDQPSEEIIRLVDLIDQRVAVMPEVALWKTAHHQPVFDPAREQKVLEQSVAGAAALNLDREAVRQFFEIQIRMAKAVEERAIADQAAHPAPAGQARDLTTVIRPVLDRIGRDLLTSAYLASPALVSAGPSALRQQLEPLGRHPGISAALLTELSQALAHLSLSQASTLAVIQRIGVLRIGTTGDYAPFSSDQGGELQGFDIQLAQSLAAQWHVRALFIRTSYASLMKDLQAHRFDLAMAGITITPERSQTADFSTPYCTDGKTAIARRGDAVKYVSLAQIDQPGVRVIENAGGTNETFARAHLTQASLIVHPDNRTIFGELLAGRADVMFTDGIEIRLQTRKHPELRAATGPLTQAQKAILLPPHSELTPSVNGWLAPQLSQGQIAQQLEHALSGSD